MRRDILLVGPDRLACSSDGRAGRKAEVRCQAVVAAVHGRPVGATFRNAAIGKSRSWVFVSMPSSDSSEEWPAIRRSYPNRSRLRTVWEVWP